MVMMGTRGAISLLGSSELVARFQRACGLFPAAPHADRGERNGISKSHREGQPVRNGTAGGLHKDHGERERSLSKLQYEVKNKPLYFLFVVSAMLGHEIFYISFLPCIHWNLDPFLCRRLINIWAVVMYIGQVMKDILKLPRPTSPPVVKLETRVDVEYGLPSTHAMAATGISFTLLLSAPERVQFPFELGLVLAVVLSALVSLSRLYTGMHSALDVICGILLSALILGVSYPYWSTLDFLQLTSPLSPVVAVVLPLYLCYNYPELDHYSTTREDTTIILGVASGCSVGYWVNQQLGLTFEPMGPFPVSLQPLTLASFGLGVARFSVGLVILVLTRQTARWVSLRLVCRKYGVAINDVEAHKRKEIEVPYKFITYSTMGVVHCVVVCRAFVLLGLL